MLAMAIEPEEITCFGTLPSGKLCDQLIARRYASGAVVVVVKGNERYLPDGRVEIDCPRCSKRVRIKPKRTAA
jgi:hypothetical protein